MHKPLAMIVMLLACCLFAIAVPAEHTQDTVLLSTAILAGDMDALAITEDTLSWDSSRSSAEDFKWGVAEFPLGLEGDFIVEADFETQRMDHWNGFRLCVTALEENRWTAYLARTTEEPGTGFVTAFSKLRNQPEETVKLPTASRKMTLRIRRTDGTVTFVLQEPDTGKETLVASMPSVYDGPVRITVNFDTPKGTMQQTSVTAIRHEEDALVPSAFMPTYSSFSPQATPSVVFMEHALRVSKDAYQIQPGGRLIMAAQVAPTARAWHLKWKSDERLIIRFMALGSKETIQLSDNVLWDDIDAELPEGLAERSVNLDIFLKRFCGDRNWKFSDVTTSGIFFFEISPAGDREVRFETPVLWGHVLQPPAHLENTIALITKDFNILNDSDGQPLAWEAPPQCARFFTETAQPDLTEPIISCGVPFHPCLAMLSPQAPALEFLLERPVGTLEVLHAAGPQPAGSPEIIAAYLLVYNDDTTAPAFATLRWNCGVFAQGWTPPDAPAGQPDTTWWGPPRFGWAAPVYFPQPPYGTSWRTLYHCTIVNPHPEKTVRALQVYQMQGDKREYLLAGLTVKPPENAVISVLDPDFATFDDDTALGVNLYEYHAVPSDHTTLSMLSMEKSPAATQDLGYMDIQSKGKMAAGRQIFTPTSVQLGPGPVTLRCNNAVSSRLGLMGPASPNDRPFYYTMICGGHEPLGDFKRINRLGYNAIKLHIGWKLDESGNPDFTGWNERFERAGRAGLRIAIRNLFVLPEELRKSVPYAKTWSQDGSIGDTSKDVFINDISVPFYREKLIDYYRRVGELAASCPLVMGINANYGQIGKLAYPNAPQGTLLFSPTGMEAFHSYLKEHFTLDEFNRQTGLTLASFNDVTIETIGKDATGTLLPAYSRWNEEMGSALIQDIAQAIRSTGCRAHLTFNVNFHPIEDKLIGSTFGAYLRTGMEYAPGSLFHESSERYTLSFVKWLAAARTCGLPYGDECCQPPPTYEHLMFAYLWMGMMQCFESNYCQWWGGRTAPQNIAQLKPWHKLIYNAEYLPDPVCLALSLQTGHDETPETINHPLHSTTMPHYGLANFLRELNINSDRYMIDDFPEFDGNVTSRLLIDDNTRAMPVGFADRIEQFIRNGGVFLASLETDKMNGYNFFKRFGVNDISQIKGEGVIPVAEIPVGKGCLAIICGNFAAGWDPGRSEAERSFMLNLLTRLGQFSPLVSSSFADVFVTPYRAANGDILISCINITAAPRKVTVGFRKDLVDSSFFSVTDLGTGLFLPAADDGDKFTVTITVPEINETILRITRQ